jgi:O-antigen/teichoic acid export membrane protein
LVSAGALPVVTGTLIGLKKFKATSAIGVGVILLRQSLIILLIILLKNFVGLVYAWVLSDSVAITVYAMYILRVVGLPKTAFSLRKLIDFSWPLSIGNIIGFVYSWFDRALLVVFVPLASLGVYNAELTALGVLVSVSTTIGTALLPVYSGISGDIDRLERARYATSLASRYVSFTIAPLAFGLLATAKPALTLFVGQAYADGTAPLMILSFFYAVTVLGLALSPMLVALAETRLVSWITLVSVLVGLASAYLLLPVLGIIGASLARSFALVITTILTIAVLGQKKAMRLDVEAVWKSLVASALMASTIFGMQMIVYDKFLLPVYMLVGVIVYLIALRLLRAVRKDDVDLIEKYLGVRLGFGSRILRVIVLPD